jgi:hypothetical protein
MLGNRKKCSPLSEQFISVVHCSHVHKQLQPLNNNAIQPSADQTKCTCTLTIRCICLFLPFTSFTFVTTINLCAAYDLCFLKCQVRHWAVIPILNIIASWILRDVFHVFWTLLGLTPASINSQNRSPTVWCCCLWLQYFVHTHVGCYAMTTWR